MKGFKWISRITALMLAAVLSFAASGTCFAEEAEAEPEIDTTNAVYLECAVDGTAMMVSQAILNEVYLIEGEHGWDFRTTAFASPVKAVIVFPTEEQIAYLQESMQAEGMEIAFAIGEYANSQWDEDYTKLAASIRVTNDHGRSLPETGTAIIVLFYDRHISLTCIDEETACSVFLMSDETVAPTVNEEYIPKIARDLGIEGDLSQVIYDSEEIAAIYGKSNTGSVSCLLSAIAASEETVLQMAPEALTGMTCGKNTSVTIERIISCFMDLRQTEGKTVFELIGPSRTLAEQVMAEVDEEWSWTGVDLSSEEYPEFPDSSFIEAFPEDQTILTVSRSEGNTPYIDYTLESLLPEQNIPASAQEADLILLADSHWEYQYTQNSIDVYACKTILYLLDGETLEVIGSVGSSFKTLSGFVMVSGSTYKPSPDKNDIKQVILNWIEG